MGNRRVQRSRIVKKEKVEAAPPAAAEEDLHVLLEKLYHTRLELQKTLALSADADETISRLTSVVLRVKQERDEAYKKWNVMLAELQARRNIQVMMKPPRAPPVSHAATFAVSGCHGSRPVVLPAPLGRVTTQAAGVSYCFVSSGQDSFDPNMFLVDEPEGNSVVPAAAATGSTSGMAGKKMKPESELDLVVQQMLRLAPKKQHAVEAPVHEEEDADAGSTSSEETVSDAGSTEAGESVDKKIK